VADEATALSLFRLGEMAEAVGQILRSYSSGERFLTTPPIVWASLKVFCQRFRIPLPFGNFKLVNAPSREPLWLTF